MCIAFFESHPENRCEHYILHYHCAHEGCDGLFESHHRLLLESAYEDCSHCLQRDGVVVDPDINPVSYYPPIDDSDLQYVPSGRWDWAAKKVDKGTGHGELVTGVNGGKNNENKGNDHMDNKSLSDVDGVTDYWHEGHLEAPPGSQYSTQHPSPVQNFPAEAEPKAFARPSSTFQSLHRPHQNTHQTPVRQIPSVQSSPNATMHRNLVNEQLAKLPHHIAHAQNRLQSTHWYPAQNNRFAPQWTPYPWGVTKRYELVTFCRTGGK